MKKPKYLTFDCYGTLTQWPLNKDTMQILGSRANGIDTEAFLEEFHDRRNTEILGEYRSHREILAISLQKAMTKFGMEYRPEDGAAAAEAVSKFEPWPDVPGVLDRLQKHFKLVIISNADDDIIAHNVKRMGANFHRVITAQQARAYKPSLSIFQHTIRELGCDPSEILHIAQDFEIDIMPASKLGWDRAWINRYAYTGDPAYGPYHEFPDLTPLPELLGI